MHSIMRFGAWTKNKPKPIAHPNRLAFILSTASCGLLSGEIATTTETTDHWNGSSGKIDEKNIADHNTNYTARSIKGIVPSQ